MITFLFPFTYTPGTGNLFFAICGARDGARSTIVANLGYHCANWVFAVLLGAGISEVLEKTPSLLSIIKLVGASYVLWIAWKIIRSDGISASGMSRTASFFDGAVVFLLNPKAYMSITLSFSLFVDEFGLDPMSSVLILSTIFVLNNFIAFHLWALLGQNITERLSNDKFAKVTNKVFAGLLFSVSIWIMFS